MTLGQAVSCKSLPGRRKEEAELPRHVKDHVAVQLVVEELVERGSPKREPL